MYDSYFTKGNEYFTVLVIFIPTILTYIYIYICKCECNEKEKRNVTNGHKKRVEK